MTRCTYRGIVPTLTLAALVLSLSGCSGEPAVTGTVTLNGEPVDGGAIIFTPDGVSGLKAAARIVDGKFTIPAGGGLSVGLNRVEILWKKKTGKQIAVPGDAGHTTDETIQVVPDVYNARSTLKEEVKEGSNTFTFELKGKATPPGRRVGRTS
jgi:hypothetical protein